MKHDRRARRNDEPETPGRPPFDAESLTDWETEGGAPTAPGSPRADADAAAAAPSPGAEERKAEGSGPEAADYKDRWLRAEADLQNYRRRAQRDLEEGRRAAEEVVLLDLAALLDDFERALQVANEGGARPAWAEGVALSIQKGRDYLARRGLAVVDPLGERFDPAFHEAILEVDPPENSVPGTVVQVVNKGYRRGDRSLRAARVVVARENAA